MFNASSLSNVGTNGGPSYYGTFDQSGLVYEWTDTTLTTKKVTRGGNYASTNVVSLSIATRLGLSGLDAGVGFRVGAKTGLSTSRIPLVDIIDRSNSNHSSGFGRVDYLYKISKFLITNAQYVDFLNSIAATDTYSVFYISMHSQPLGGILRYGSSGSYTYVCKPDMANRPVNYVSWHSAARYCNFTTILLQAVKMLQLQRMVLIH